MSPAEVVRELLRVVPDPESRALARLRLADTAFATAIGLGTEQGGRSAALAESLHGGGSLAGRAYRLAAACRMTEIDDIDLLSCTTPGAAVIPTVLAVGAPDEETALDAIVLGYEVMTGLGECLAGPRRLATGVWPSLAVAGVTSAVVTTLLLGVDDDVLDAAVLAAQQSSTDSPRGSSREHQFGTAVVAGIGSALAVRGGFRPVGHAGDSPVGRLLADPLETAAGPRIGRPGVKPWCSARQAMTAIAATRELVVRHGLKDGDIESIDVEVPHEYAAMLDKAAVHTRRDSISSAAYQLALAVARPDGLLDVDRTDLDVPPLADLMARVQVRGSAELSARYPREWPARVAITAGGTTYGHEARTAPGENDLTTTALAAKTDAFVALHPHLAGPAAAIVAAPVADLLEIVDNEGAPR